MKKHLSKKRVIIATLVAVALAIASGVAYAYFTSSGAGSGTATVGTSSAMTITGTSASTLLPGTTSQITLSANNPLSSSQYLGVIYLSGIKACQKDSAWNGSACAPVATEITTCESVDPGNVADVNVSNFYMADVSVNLDLTAGLHALVPTGTLKMHDLAVSQDTCKNAALYLQFATR
jgi:hypothetical protein